MKKIILVLITVIYSVGINAQDTYLKWAKQFSGGSNFDQGRKIKADDAGNVYSVGFFRGTVDFDPGPGVYDLTSAGEADIFISKLDPDGNFLWAERIGGSMTDGAISLAIDVAGNLLVSGDFESTVDFDPGPGIFDLTGGLQANAFVLKLSSNGDFIWVKQFSSNLFSYTFSCATDLNNNICICGSFVGTVDFDPGPGVFNLTSQGSSTYKTDIFLLKLNANGDLLWAFAMGEPEQDLGAIVNTDPLGNIYMTANFQNTVDFDPGPGINNLTSNGQSDFAIVKLSAAGDLIWARSIGSARDDYGYTPAIDEAGNVYVTGFFQGTADFDPGPGVFNMTPAGSGDAIFVLKLTSAGDFVWARHMGGTSYNNWGYDLALDGSDNVYTTGFFTSSGDFDPGPGTFILNASVLDIFISKLDKNGNFVWAKSIGGSAVDQGLGIYVDSHRNIYMTGIFGSVVDFDPEAPVYNLTAADGQDIFVLKLAQCLSPAFNDITASSCNSYTLNSQVYTSSGTYMQTLISAAGCDSIITLHLTINPTAFTTVNANICQGQSYFAGGANQTTTGVYKDTLLTSLGCDSIISTNLTVFPLPKPDLGPDRKICSNTLATISPGTFNSYLWQDNSTLPYFTLNAAGQYWVMVTGAGNCKATDTLNIIALDTIPVNFLPADQQLCYGNVFIINVPGYKDYLWNTGEQSSTLAISSFGTHYLTVTDYNNCIGTDTINIIRKNCMYIGIPNAFTPNKDTKNDIFKPIINQAIKQYSFVVYNRYGQKIFETHDYSKGWDGTYKGKDQPIGTYVYRILYTNIFGYESENNGTVMLLR